MKQQGSGFGVRGSGFGGRGVPTPEPGPRRFSPSPYALTPRPSAGRRPAFSLAEMMVAIGILGIGLTMVACFFPVAIYQHANTTSQQRAMEIARRAKTLVMNAPESQLIGEATPSFWPLWQLTSEFGDPGANWEHMIIPPANPGDPNVFYREVRYVWHLLARREQGITQYMVAVCRVLPGQRFLNVYDPGKPNEASVEPIPWPVGANWVFPMAIPLWGVGPKRLNILFIKDFEPWASGGLPLLIPPASKLISKRTGLVYTVIDIDMSASPPALDLREALAPRDIGFSGIPLAPPSFIIFPPPISGFSVGDTIAAKAQWDAVQYGDKSPLVMVMSF